MLALFTHKRVVFCVSGCPIVSAAMVGRKKKRIDNSKEARKARGEWTTEKPIKKKKNDKKKQRHGVE
jgi:3'-phosphoadenosine 5'-phosphosulfate (PAPS) 3'-phosphatase